MSQPFSERQLTKTITGILTALVWLAVFIAGWPITSWITTRLSGQLVIVWAFVMVTIFLLALYRLLVRHL